MSLLSLRSVMPLTSVALLAACAALAPLVDPGARAPDLPGFGSVQMQVTTSVPAARRWFLQGMEQAYAFNEKEAVRAFKAALAQDPQCALCAWGVAWQLGPNINAVARGDLRDALRYARHARTLAAGATPLERALVDAMVLRYADSGPAEVPAPMQAAVCSSGGAGKAHPLDLVYAQQLRQLADAHPGDPNVLSFYAEAEMIATRDDWWDRKTGRAAGRMGDVADRLERAAAVHADHTGVNHYLIHAVDASNVAARAVAAADRLGALAPQSPHLVHMPAHIYVRVGRYADAANVNLAAVDAQRLLDERVAGAGFVQTRNWNGHNQHFLWFGALMQGRGDLALETARKLATRFDKATHAWGAYQRGLPLLTLARLGRWNEVLSETADATRAERMPGLFEHARGVALAHGGRMGEADAMVAALDQRLVAARKAAKPDDDEAKAWVEMYATLAAQLKAEVALARGDAAAALVAGREAVRAEEAMGDFEPPLLAGGSQRALADLLLRSQRYAEAEATFRADLAAQPGNGWALRGLHGTLTAQGRLDEAARVQGEWTRAWAGADASLRKL